MFSFILSYLKNYRLLLLLLLLLSRPPCLPPPARRTQSSSSRWMLRTTLLDLNEFVTITDLTVPTRPLLLSPVVNPHRTILVTMVTGNRGSDQFLREATMLNLATTSSTNTTLPTNPCSVKHLRRATVGTVRATRPVASDPAQPAWTPSSPRWVEILNITPTLCSRLVLRRCTGRLGFLPSWV